MRERLTKHIDKAQKGDAKSMDMLLRYFTKSAYRDYGPKLLINDTEDAMQFIREKAWQGILSYTSEFNSNPLLYIKEVMRRGYVNFIKNESRQKYAILKSAASLDLPLKMDGENQVTLSDYVADKFNLEKTVIAKQNIHSAYRELADKLSPLEKDVLELRLDGNWGYDSQKFIAKCLNIKIRSVDNAIERIKRKARKIGWTERSLNA